MRLSQNVSEGTVHPTLWPIDVILNTSIKVFGQQWSSMTQRNKIYQTIIGFAFFMVFVDTKLNIELYQTYPLVSNNMQTVTLKTCKNKERKQLN